MSNELKSAYKALTADQQALIESRRITGQGSPDEWLELLIPVAQFESDAARVRDEGGFFARRYARRHSMPDGFRAFTLDLLPTLREDHDPDAPMTVSLDFSGTETEEKLTHTSEPYQHGAYRKIVDSFYEDPLVEVRARFADGADVHLSVTDHLRATKKTKKSASGKTKTKTKHKCQATLEVEVTFPAKLYNAGTQPSGVQAAAVKEKVKARDNKTVVRLSRSVPGSAADGSLGLQELIDLLGAAYGRVEPGRRKKL